MVERNGSLVHAIRAHPSNRQIVPAAAFFLEGFNVIARTRNQGDRGAFLLGQAVPLAWGGPTQDPGDPTGLIRTGVGTQEQSGVVIGSDPEGVLATQWGREDAPQALSIILGHIGGGLEKIRDDVGGRRLIGKSRVVGQRIECHTRNVAEHLPQEGAAANWQPAQNSHQHPATQRRTRSKLPVHNLIPKLQPNTRSEPCDKQRLNRAWRERFRWIVPAEHGISSFRANSIPR